MYAASTKQPENLSQSALSYLQSLDRATKALRQNQTTEKNTSGRRSHLSGKTPSIESSSSTGEERILFDFPFEGGKEESRKFSVASNELPGLHLGRKSISELRELRTSIDHSLIKPPKLQKQYNTRRRLSSASRKESSDVRDESETEEQVPVVKEVEDNPSSGSSTLREYGTDFDSVSTDDNAFKADPSSDGASTIEEVSHRDGPRRRTEAENPTLSSEKSLELKAKPKRKFCSSNVHHVTKDVLHTHLRLLKEFNRLEWTSLQEWNAILDDIREKYDGPSTEKLKAVIERRTNQFNMT
ncbi:hypothetical protein TELCIR_02910 [Teladorsagia circumcincta]|uniref:Uncharacterized protein n=1 Tax=Teladorsagia circumcincta TaxID=45464 RepID=A0A2G9UXV4_TELCI|nr:hypothetical protein TELCIR_02910 [Teladorsagia circumcincta]